MHIRGTIALLALHLVSACHGSSLRIDAAGIFDAVEAEEAFSDGSLDIADVDDLVARRRKRPEVLPPAMTEAPELELIVENKFEHLIKDKKGVNKWEASAVNFARGAYYVVFDNLHGMPTVSRLHDPSCAQLKCERRTCRFR
jgi:hypothetical protein